jgi:hypothetical protein
MAGFKSWAPALLAGTTLLLIGGCADLDKVLDPEVDTVEFDCDNDRDIRVAFLDDGERVRLFSGDDDVELRLVDRRDDGDVRVYENGSGSVQMLDQGERIEVRVDDKQDFEDCEAHDPDYRRDGGAF